MLCKYGYNMTIYFSGCLVALLCVIHFTKVHSISKLNIFISSLVVVSLSWITPIMLLIFYITYKIQYNK